MWNRLPFLSLSIMAKDESLEIVEAQLHSCHRTRRWRRRLPKLYQLMFSLIWWAPTGRNVWLQCRSSLMWVLRRFAFTGWMWLGLIDLYELVGREISQSSGKMIMIEMVIVVIIKRTMKHPSLSEMLYRPSQNKQKPQKKHWRCSNKAHKQRGGGALGKNSHTSRKHLSARTEKRLWHSVMHTCLW